MFPIELPRFIPPDPVAAPGRGPGRRLRALACAAWLCHGLPALAGPEGPAEPPVPAELLVSDWRLGPFYAKPFLEVRNAGTESNALLAETDPIQDFRSTFAGGLRLALPVGDNVMELKGEASYDYSREFPENRVWGFGATFDVRATAGDAQIALADSLRRTNERLVGEVTTRALRVENVLTGSLGTARDAGIYLDGYAGANTIRYDKAQTYNGVNLAESLDRTEVRAGGALYLEFLGPTRLVGGAEWLDNRMRVTESGRDARGYFVYSGLRFEEGGNWVGDVRVGRRSLDFRAPEVSDFAELSYDASLSVELGGSGRLRFTASQGPAYSTALNTIWYTSNQYGGLLAVPAGDWLRLELGPTFQRARYPESLGGRRDDVTWFEAAGILPLIEDVRLRVGVLYQHRTSSATGASYDGTSLLTSLSYGL